MPLAELWPEADIGADAHASAEAVARPRLLAQAVERHLHRRWAAAVGYGPKIFARVARLRRLVALPDVPLAERALIAGYASQAHLTDEVRRLTGMTPVRFLEDARLTAA